MIVLDIFFARLILIQHTTKKAILYILKVIKILCYRNFMNIIII